MESTTTTKGNEMTNERYIEVELDMAEAIVIQTIDTWTGEIADERTVWKPGFEQA